MGLGVRTAFVRFAAEYEANEELGMLYGCMILINVICAAIVVMLTFLFLKPIFRSVLHIDQVSGLVILTCCAAASQSLCLNIMTYYRAKNEGMKYMVASISVAIALLVINWYFLVNLRLGVPGVLIAQIVTYGGLCILIAFKIYQKIGLGLSLETTKKLLIFGFPLTFFMLGGFINESSSIYLLSYFTDLEQVAIYSLGYKIAGVVTIVLMLPFELAYEPFVFAHKDDPEIKETISRLLTYLLILFTLVTGVIVTATKFFLPIIAPSGYSSAYIVTFLILPGLAFYGVMTIGQSLLHINNKTYVTGTTTSIIALLSIALQLYLIPKYGIYAVIFTSNLSFISTGILLMVFGIKEFPIVLEKMRLLITGIFLFSILFLSFYLWDKASFIFYSVIPITMTLSLCLFYITGFFRVQEKAMIKDIYSRILTVASN